MKHTDKTITLTIDTTKADIKEALEYLGGDINPAVFDMNASLLEYNMRAWHPSNNFQYGASLISILDILKEARLERKTQNQFNQSVLTLINKVYGKHRINYLKWNITDDLSLRYFFTFQDRRELEGKFVIKSHSEKKYITIDTIQKLNYIFKEFVKDKENFTQIVGKNTKGKYIKLCVNKDSIYGSRNDKLMMFYLNEQNIPDVVNV